MTTDELRAEVLRLHDRIRVAQKEYDKAAKMLKRQVKAERISAQLLVTNEPKD